MNIFSRFFASLFSGFTDKRLWQATGGTRMTRAKVEVNEHTAFNYSVAWCATRLLCGTGASLPLPIYSGADDETRTKERKHPAFRLLNRAPNNEMTAFNFRAILWQWQVNSGNAYAEIVREGNNSEGPLMELHPIHPTRVRVLRDEEDQLFYEVKNKSGIDPTYLLPWQMLHIPSIITYDGISGRGVIEHAAESFGTAMGAEQRTSNSFGTGALPVVAVEMPPGKLWTEEQRKEFRREWKEIYSGPDGDTVAILQGGATAKAMGFSAQDSQFLELRQFMVEEFARWYGVPPHLLQHLLRATFNNVEELGIDFVRYGLNLWLKAWEHTIWQKLFTEAEQETYFAEHNVDALLRGNSAARAAFYQAMTSAALMSRNECRKLENLDPVKGGDVFLVQGATVPLDDDGKPESEFVSGPAPKGLPAPAPEDDSPDVESISANIRNVLSSDLNRMLTKEGKAVSGYAKRPDKFTALVDEFYAEHSALLTDAVTHTVSALHACGVEISREQLVSEWVREGKSLILEAAGVAKAADLSTAVQSVIDSTTWAERPAKAIERANNATPIL